MIRVVLNSKRRAVAMIELIFAIVVIGIAMLSIPTLISTATQSSAVVLQQEAINEAAAKANSILSYHWDEADSDEKFIDPILIVSAGAAELQDYNSTGRRRGTPINSLRTFVRADGIRLPASTVLGLESGETEQDDMDDFNGEDVGLTLVESATSDYVEKNTTSIKTAVKYMPDMGGASSFQTTSLIFNPDFTTPVPAGKSSNIKLISVTLTSTSGIQELSKTIVLRSFGCNIGAVELEERKF